MACDVTYFELSLYHAGELDDERTREIEKHLPGCAVCRQRLETLGMTAVALASVPRFEPSAAALLKVRKALSRRVRGEEREVMTLEEVAEFMRVSQDDLEEVVDDLPAFEIAGRVRVRRDRLLAWIAKRERTYRTTAIESDVARILSGRF